MRRIFKYPVQVTDEFTLMMPYSAKPLSVQTQGGRPCLWALVDDDAPTVSRTFCVVGTGNPFPENAHTFVGTWQDGPFVWHLFEASRSEGGDQ